MSPSFEQSMPSKWEIAKSPFAEHVVWARAGHFLFASPEWANVVAGLGADVHFAWNATAGYGAIVPVFKRHGLRIGFFGFPVLGAPWDEMPIGKVTAQASLVAQSAKLTLIRLTQCEARVYDEAATAARPEIWISDLQNWTPASSKRLRKDLAFSSSEKSGIQVITDHAGSIDWYSLYAKTVLNHSGKLRYTPAYFERLLELAKSSSRVKILTAVDRIGAVCGFVALAIHGNVAYYLHSAVDEARKRLGVSDLLMTRLIDEARGLGATRFTMMSSPWDQPGLVKFKSKWGDTHGLSVTYDLGHGLIGRLARAAANWQSRHDRAAALQYQIDMDSTLTQVEGRQ